MGLRFIFMLTRNDKTVVDAEIHLAKALSAGVHHIGFKDVGLPFNALKKLNTAIKSGGATSYLEVVSLDRESEIASARAAIDIGVDILLGGTHVNEVVPLLSGTDIQYYPFPGEIIGHPSVLAGSIDEIVSSAKLLASKDGVDGLDLLAYRSTQDVPKLMAAVCAATDIPVIMAGSIDTLKHISDVKKAGAAGFTIGTAALDGNYPARSNDLSDQLAAIMKDVAEVNNHISPYMKKNLDQSFNSFQEKWSPKIVGQINGMQIKVAKFEGDFIWQHHVIEDALFLVHKGQLMMKYRDRDEIIGEGEFIIVPHGVDHCPVAMSDTCEVILLEPGTTLNPDSASDKRTVTVPSHI